MIKKELIDYLSNKLNIKRKELIEKDLLLHCLLREIESCDYFKDNLVFKGGTCLIKCYLGYYRFSEDIDFSWINQKEFEKKSQKEIRRLLSVKIEKVMLILEKSAAKLGIDFKAEKRNKKYVEFGGSNKLATFKLWYKSGVLNTESFIKIQINFVELFEFPFVELPVKSIVKGIDIKEFKFLFPEFDLKKIRIKAYDAREILIEKVRAILTRRSIKAGDFIDVFLIVKNKNIDIEKLKKEILAKTRFMLRYEKYIQNLKEFQLEKFVVGEEERLLLKPIDKGFYNFISDFRNFLIALAEEIKP